MNTWFICFLASFISLQFGSGEQTQNSSILKIHNKRSPANLEKTFIYSGPYPCIDKNGSPVLPPYLGGPPFWYTDDQCHTSVCPGPLVLTKSLGCFMKGIMCPPGSYLEVPPKPQSIANCCLCKPIKKLKKRSLKSETIKPILSPVLQKQAQLFVYRKYRELWEADKRSRIRKRRVNQFK